MDLIFEVINLDQHFDICYEFRRDSFICSFGTEVGYEESVVGYQAKIHERLNNSHWFYLHIWHDEKIIGQLEFKSFSFLERTGYIHLIYITPEFRGLGVADKAESVIVERLKELYCHSAVVVGEQNQRTSN